MRTGDEIVYSYEVKRFIEVAERFCSVIDRLEGLSEIDLLRDLDILLPLAYACVRELPEMDYTDEHEDSPEALTNGAGTKGHYERWKELSVRIEDKLGKHTSFRHVHDPANPKDQEVCVASLADELAEVYVGLRGGLDLYGRDAPHLFKDALERWRVDVLIWPNSAKDAIAPVYALVHDHYDEDDEVFDI